MLRTYSELRRLETFEDRYDYLRLRGEVGQVTFGFERHLNQKFYTSLEWRRVRNHIIVRDQGCDLGVEGFDIHQKIIIHHMNPITVENLREAEDHILDPEFLISTTHRTHNAIHYGDERLLPRPHVERRPGDTLLWGKKG